MPRARRVTSAADLAEQAAKQRREQEVAAVLAALERSHGIGGSPVHPKNPCTRKGIPAVDTHAAIGVILQQLARAISAGCSVLEKVSKQWPYSFVRSHTYPTFS